MLNTAYLSRDHVNESVAQFIKRHKLRYSSDPSKRLFQILLYGLEGHKIERVNK